MASPYFSPKFNLSIVVLSALFCLTPIFNLSNEAPYSTDDSVVFGYVTSTLVQRSPSLMASFFVALIPAGDLFLDVPSHFFSFFYGDKKLARRSDLPPAVVRLSDLERFSFIVGVGIQSCVWFSSESENIPTLGILYFSTTNSSILLVAGPILAYLQRCTTTFTSLRVLSISIIGSLGFAILTICNFFRNDIVVYRILNQLGSLLTSIACLIYVVLTFWCAIKYLNKKLNTVEERDALISCMNCKAGRLGTSNDSTDNDTELYENHIPALHVTALFIIFISSAYTHLISLLATDADRGTAYERKNYVCIVAQIIVLITELRIRKNEIARGLVSLYLNLSYLHHVAIGDIISNCSHVDPYIFSNIPFLRRSHC
jgi:hypothetical protein